jgi:hypothetical protein
MAKMIIYMLFFLNILEYLQLHKGVSALSQQFTEYPGGGVEETLI